MKVGSDTGFDRLVPNLKNKKEDHFEKKQVPSTIKNNKVKEMKKKKLTSLDILDGKVGKNATLSRSEMKNIMAGSGSQCNCLYCQMSNGGLNTYAADCATNPPNYPSLYCFWFTGDPGVNGSYGIC